MDTLLSRSHAAYWMLVTRSALYHEIVYSLIRSKSLVTPAGLFSLDVLIPRQESWVSARLLSRWSIPSHGPTRYVAWAWRYFESSPLTGKAVTYLAPRGGNPATAEWNQSLSPIPAPELPPTSSPLRPLPSLPVSLFPFPFFFIPCLLHFLVSYLFFLTACFFPSPSYFPLHGIQTKYLHQRTHFPDSSTAVILTEYFPKHIQNKVYKFPP